MACDMFMKIDDIKGESSDAAHKGEIDVYSWNWGVTQTGSSQTKGGSGTGRANVADFEFTTKIETSHAALLAGALRGKPFKSAVLTCRKAGDKPLEYLKITMTNGLISKVNFTGTVGDEETIATIALNFGTVKWDYTPQAADGSGQATVSMGQDVAGNQPIG